MANDEMEPSYPGTQFIAASSATSNTWPAWNVTYTTTGMTLTNGAASMHILNSAWGAWNATLCTGSSICATATGNTWPQWNDDYIAYARRLAHPQRAPTQAELLAEVARKKAEEAQWAERQRREARRVAEAQAARRRAADLLQRSLSDEQREDLAKKNCFYLESVTPGGERRRYRIDRGTHGNVKLLDKDGSIVGTYCVQPNDVPVEDATLAQKLWIETDEKAFLKVANFSPYRLP